MFNKRLIKAVPQARQSIIKNVLFQWLGLLCSIVSTLTLTYTTASALRHELTNQIILLTVILLTISLYLRSLCTKKAGRYAAASSHQVKKAMRSRLFEKLTQLGPAAVSQFAKGEITSLTGDGIEQLESYFASYLPQFFYALIAPVTLFVLIAFWDLKAALILLVCVPLIPASIILVQKFAKKLLSRYWNQYTGLSDTFLENLEGLTTLKVYDADKARHQKMNEEAEQFRKITMRVLIMQLNSISIMDLVAYGGASAGILTALSAHLPFFQTLAIILLSSEFFLPMRLLGSYFHVSMNGSAAADRMFQILDATVSKADTKLEALPLHYEIRNLTYRYDNDKIALENICMSLPATGFAGICGASGSGKSTLANLLCGRLTDTTSALTINDMPQKDIDPADLLQHVGVLSMESVIFDGTVADNLRLAKSDATGKEMRAALLQAGLDLELECHVGEGGRLLSGGQKQRLALARLLLKDAPVLILDEATSSLDEASEQTVMDTARHLAADHLVICISHRLHNLEKADVIYVLDQGRLAEKGNHEQLLAQKSIYTRLYQEQEELESYTKEVKSCQP